MARSRPLRPAGAPANRSLDTTSKEAADRRILAAAFCLGAGGLILEIALTRLFSVLLFYHYVFLVLAVALLGLGLGGGLAALLPDRATRGQTYAASAAGL